MRALIVAYYFPPKGGAGTQRFAKFAKFLPAHGVEPVVLTVDEGLRSEHAPIDDQSLLEQTRCEVLRVPPPPRATSMQRLRRRLRLHVDEDEWAAAAAERALAAARERKFDVCVTTLSPYANYTIGARLQQELGVPWVVDLRDPWALDAWRVYPTPLHARRDLARLARVLRQADFVIANVPEARRAFLDLGADPARTVVIPNGYDDEDFADVAAQGADPARPFTLVHMGTFHPADLPPGLTRNRWRRVRHRQIEPLGRTGYYLLHAVAAWLGANPAARARLAVRLFGRADASHERLIDALGIGDVVRTEGYLPHRESIAALAAADAVFVPLHGLPAGERALVVPGKLYEALASERPVLAALPEGDGADLVRRLDAGLVAGATDVAAIAAALGTLVTAWQRGAAHRGCARDRLVGFSRRRLTGLLAQVLTAAAGGRRTVEVVDPWRALG
ncbi:MAG: glycosyltransferase [Planctomycetes bacterium]|nr:glycosyltransferase [Planctomycetota bacterium]